MRMLKQQLIVVAAVIGLTACAGKPTFQSSPPQTVGAKQYQLSHSSLLAMSDHMTKPMNAEQDIIYFQNFGGGGAAVGLLLGPFGVAANIAAINSNTEDDVKAMSGQLKLQPVQLFKDAAYARQFDLAGKAALTVSPFVYVSKTENEQLYLASALIVENNLTGKEKWVGRYFYQTELKVAKSTIIDGLSAEELANFNAALRNGFEQAIELFEKDNAGQLLSQNEVTVSSDFLSPRFALEQFGQQVAADNDRVNVRLMNGVFSLPKASVKLTNRKG